MGSVAVKDHAGASSVRGVGRSRTGRALAAPEFESLEWLEDSKHPLDWNGSTTRIFSKFRDEDIDRPIIALFERVVRRHRNRIALTDSDTSLSFVELWDGLSGLAETIAAETKPGDLIGILLPACSMFPLAVLACLAAGRPFVALDPHYPSNWLSQVLEDARPALIIAREDIRRKDVPGGVATSAPTRVIHLTRLPQSARKGLATGPAGPAGPARVGPTRVRVVYLREHGPAQRHRQQSAEHSAACRPIYKRRAYQRRGQVSDSGLALHHRRRARHDNRAARGRQRSPARYATRRRTRDFGCYPRRGHHNLVRVSGAVEAGDRGCPGARGRRPQTGSDRGRHHAVERHRSAARLARAGVGNPVDLCRH